MSAIPLPSEPEPGSTPRTDPGAAVEAIRGRTRGERLRETVWDYLGQPLMRRTLERWTGLRRGLLRLFGARIHPSARISRTVRIHRPWNLTLDEGSVVGRRAILFCLGPIRIGRRCRVSQFAHLCAGSHDYTRTDMALITDPIVLEENVWVAADAFIGPGVTIGHDTIVGARATVLHSRGPELVCVGDHASPIHPRTPAGGPGAASRPGDAPA
jgi:putative colanic acid biosynthesis acetyltransferase WcaF